MYSFIFGVSCIFASFSLFDATCLSSQTNGNSAAFSVQQHQNYPVDTYCINLAIRYQADNDKFMEFHTKDYEIVAKSFLLNLNSTIRNRINIDCQNNPSVKTGDNSVAYSYNCCKDDSNINGVVCANPTLINIDNGAFQQMISFTTLMTSFLVFYINL
uniref:Transmembrane protein n=1 Tax=Panagrolaimus sp. PS1159 TaxID=55785 RepID=A0AC35F4R0_9BILA